MEVENIITDFALNLVFENTNFGGMSNRDVVSENLAYVDDGYSIGNTAKLCLLELGLIYIDKRPNKLRLSKLGKEYLKLIRPF